MTALLEVDALSKRFGAVVAADDISVSIERGALVSLIGANGAGKTTFINMVTGYLRPDAGAIWFDGIDIARLPPRKIVRRGLGRSFQMPQLFVDLDVFDNVVAAIGLSSASGMGWFRNARDRETRAHAESLLERFSLTAYRDAMPSSLPSGVRKLLDIAVAVAGRPKMLLLDEPTSGVSAEEKLPLMDQVTAAVQDGHLTILFVEHDMELVRRYSNRTLAFYGGKVIADGEPEAVMNESLVREVVVGDIHE